MVEGDSDRVTFGNLDKVLEEEGVQLRLFGKPEVRGHRRMGVILATADSTAEAREKTLRAINKLEITLGQR